MTTYTAQAQIVPMHDEANPPERSDSPQLGGAHRSARTGQEPELSGMRPRVLVLDDMVDNVLLLTTVLELRGCRVTGVMNGDEAMEQLQSQQWDLFITDILHPGMAAVMLCRYIRGTPTLATLPILMVTADERGCEEINEYYSVRVFCIAKPVNFPRFLQAVNDAITARRLGLPFPSE